MNLLTAAVQWFTRHILSCHCYLAGDTQTAKQSFAAWTLAFNSHPGIKETYTFLSIYIQALLSTKAYYISPKIDQLHLCKPLLRYKEQS